MALELPGGWVGESIADPSTFPLWIEWLSVRDQRCDAQARKSIAETHAWVLDVIAYQNEPAGTDVWQPPADTLRLGTGDCEDFAILDRALLLTGGLVADEQCWLLIVHDLDACADHALLWLPGCYLDCRCRDPLLPEQFADYAPIAGFAANQAVLFGRRG